MKFLFSFICSVFIVCTTYATEAVTSEARYLDYGSEFSHPLYQARYKTIHTGDQKDPDVFLFLCGRGMSIEMYQDWIKDFVALEAREHSRGVVVYVMNFPGQIVLETDQIQRAASGWRGVAQKLENKFERQYRGSIKHYNEYILATNAMVRTIYDKYRKPIVIMAHSMGGHVALRYALHTHQAFDLDKAVHARDYLTSINDNPMALEISRGVISSYRLKSPQDLIRGMVLVSPMFDINTGKFVKKLSRALATLASFVGLGGAYVPGSSYYNHLRDKFQGNKQTSSEEGYMQLKKLRQEYGVPMVTYAWLKATFDSIIYLEEADFSAFSTPVLVTLSKDEKVVLNEEARLILSRIQSAEIKALEGMHTPFVETPQIRLDLIRNTSQFLSQLRL